MKQDGSIQLFHYWNRLRNGRHAPKRMEIEPFDIKSLLADTFILEEDLHGEALFRLAGTRLCGIYGHELKGFSFPSLWMEKDRRLISRLTYEVFAKKCGATINFTGTNCREQAIPLELLLLPLDDGADSSCCLGILSTGRWPLWAGVDPVREARIETVQVIDPDREPLFLGTRQKTPVPALVPSKAGETLYLGRRIRHLVVLEGGRS